VTTVSEAPPIYKNGNFESGTSEGWSVISQTGSGAVISVVKGGVGGVYCLDISTSYFVSSTASSVVVAQTLNTEAGKKYRLVIDTAVVSSYTNGNPWSIVIGGQTISSGVGSATAWTVTIGTFTAQGNDELQLRMSSANNRAGRLQVDNIALIPLT
jgi:hypothetical protein